MQMQNKTCTVKKSKKNYYNGMNHVVLKYLHTYP